MEVGLDKGRWQGLGKLVAIDGISPSTIIIIMIVIIIIIIIF